MADRIWTGCGACAAADARSRFHCQIGVVLGDEDRVRLQCGAGARRNKSAGLHDAIERLAIDSKSFTSGNDPTEKARP